MSSCAARRNAVSTVNSTMIQAAAVHLALSVQITIVSLPQVLASLVASAKLVTFSVRPHSATVVAGTGWDARNLHVIRRTR